jgi:hypothetical protein
MNDTKNFLSPNENKIRYSWAIFFALQTIFGLIILIKDFITNQLPLHNSIIIAIVVPLLVMQYLIFHFIFLKHGTKLLTVLIYWMPISCIISLISGYKLGQLNYLMMGSWVITFIWYGLLFEMKKINQRLRTQ